MYYKLAQSERLQNGNIGEEKSVTIDINHVVAGCVIVCYIKFCVVAWWKTRAACCLCVVEGILCIKCTMESTALNLLMELHFLVQLLCLSEALNKSNVCQIFMEFNRLVDFSNTDTCLLYHFRDNINISDAPSGKAIQDKRYVSKSRRN